LEKAVIGAGGDPSGWEIPQWSPESDEAFMKKNGINTTILSLTAPGACILKGESAAKLARQANEYAAKMRDNDPSRYGFLAALPSLTDKSLALSELAYALDELKADGVTLFTRYGAGNQYLGHPDFKYIWEEIAKRGAVVFIHPTHPVDTTLVSPLLPQPVIDYPFETTRTAVDLIVSKTIRDFPNIKIILPHAGGTLPYLLGRPASVMPYLSTKHVTEEIIEDARNFYYDTAVAGSENVLTVLEKFAKPGHILYGSDYPYAGPGIIKYHNEGLDAFPFKDQSLLKHINTDGSLELWPRLKQYQK
jgi:predicted TIM-barrel fold metal-dependent hydrolase